MTISSTLMGNPLKLCCVYKYKLHTHPANTIAGGTHLRPRHFFSNRWDFGLRTVACPLCTAIMWK